MPCMQEPREAVVMLINAQVYICSSRREKKGQRRPREAFSVCSRDTCDGIDPPLPRDCLDRAKRAPVLKVGANALQTTDVTEATYQVVILSAVHVHFPLPKNDIDSQQRQVVAQALPIFHFCDPRFKAGGADEEVLTVT